MKTLHEQLVELRRELRLRQHFYPIWCNENRKGYNWEICRHRIECVESTIAVIEKQIMLEEASSDLFKRQEVGG